MSVEIIDIPTQKVASIRKIQPSSHLGSFLSAAAIQILVYLKELGRCEFHSLIEGISGSGSGFAITHSRDESKSEVDVEVCVPISPDSSGLAKDRGDIKFK